MSFPDLGGLAQDLVATGVIQGAGAPIATIGTIVSAAGPVVQTQTTPGNYYGAVLTSVIGVGTLLVQNAGAASAAGTLLGYLSVPTTAVSNGILGGLATPYSTLVASVLGTIQANIYYT